MYVNIFDQGCEVHSPMLFASGYGQQAFKRKHVIIFELLGLIITVSISLIIINLSEFQISDEN